MVVIFISFFIKFRGLGLQKIPVYLFGFVHNFCPVKLNLKITQIYSYQKLYIGHVHSVVTYK